MSRTLQESLVGFLLDEGHTDADGWSEIKVAEDGGLVELSWREWRRGERGDGTAKVVRLGLTIDEFLTRVWNT